jgi:hypothetical protein
MTTEKVGIAMPPELLSEIEESMGAGHSRSQKINDLCRVALSAERVMIDRGYYHPNPSKREQIVAEALEQYDPDEGTVLS